MSSSTTVAMSSAFPATEATPAGHQQTPRATFGTILRRAVLAGLVAGALAAVFVGLVAEDSIDAAIDIEEATAGADTPEGSDEAAGGHSHGDEEPLFTRGQQVVGGLTAAVLFGLVVGVVFGTVYAAIRHKITVGSETGRILLLAAAAYLATAVLPSLKYPANPPAVGDPDTVNERTLLYFTFLAAAIILAVAVGMLYKRLAVRLERSAAVVSTAAAALAGAAVLLVVWPSSPDTVTEGFPAQLLWDFRLESLATLTIIWSTFGLGMGWLSRPRT